MLKKKLSLPTHRVLSVQPSSNKDIRFFPPCTRAAKWGCRELGAKSGLKAKGRTDLMSQELSARQIQAPIEIASQILQDNLALFGVYLNSILIDDRRKKFNDYPEKLDDLNLNVTISGQHDHKIKLTSVDLGNSCTDMVFSQEPGAFVPVHHGFLSYPDYIISLPITPQSEHVGNALVRGCKVAAFYRFVMAR